MLQNGQPIITEATLTKMLRELPVAIIVTKRENGYAWQFLQGCGVAPTYLDAMREAFTYLQGAKMTE